MFVTSLRAGPRRPIKRYTYSETGLKALSLSYLTCLGDILQLKKFVISVSRHIKLKIPRRDVFWGHVLGYFSIVRHATKCMCSGGKFSRHQKADFPREQGEGPGRDTCPAA